MSRILTIVGLVLAPFALLIPASALAYDTSWYRNDFWAGEYPHGFTLKKDVTTKIRAKPDPDTPKLIGCALKKGATYHPWNEDRVASSKLDFISYVPIVTYVITKSSTVILRDDKTDTEVKLSLGKGDEWSYLTYYAEGFFRMSYKGMIYTADQDLMEDSMEKSGTAINKTRNDDEWLKLTCANGASGWLLLEDVVGHSAFGAPKILGYGKASDAN